ncbi:MAG: hypothetical protein NTZ48_01695 [Candidatus Omnitrophica bacterium]|nr:hypothetical protein [Candidatus Omnitrophota bacterium]
MKRKKGQALIVATVLFIFLVIILGEAVLLYMRNHHRLNVKQLTLTDDFYYAQGGIERAKYKLKVDSTYTGESNPSPLSNTINPDMLIEIKVKGAGILNQFIITSRVLQKKSGGELSVVREIEALVERIDDPPIDGKIYSHVNLLGWTENPPQAQ